MGRRNRRCENRAWGQVSIVKRMLSSDTYIAFAGAAALAAAAMPSPARDFGNLRAVGGDQVFCGCLITRRNVRVMPSLPDILASVPQHWWIALIVSAVGIAAICLRVLESDGVRAKRGPSGKAERNCVCWLTGFRNMGRALTNVTRAETWW